MVPIKKIFIFFFFCYLNCSGNLLQKDISVINQQYQSHETKQFFFRFIFNMEVCCILKSQIRINIHAFIQKIIKNTD